MLTTYTTTKGVYKPNWQYFQYLQYFWRVSEKFPKQFPRKKIMDVLQPYKWLAPPNVECLSSQ